jgi:hypothetical protein
MYSGPGRVCVRIKWQRYQTVICLETQAENHVLQGLQHWSTKDPFSPRHLFPPPVCPGVRVHPFVSLTCNSYLCFETDHCFISWPFLGTNNESNNVTSICHMYMLATHSCNTLFCNNCLSHDFQVGNNNAELSCTCNNF